MRADRSHLRRHFLMRFHFFLAQFVLGRAPLKINAVLCFGVIPPFPVWIFKFFLPNCTFVSMISSTAASCEVQKVSFHLKRCERGCEVFQATLGRNIPLAIGTIFLTLNKSLTVRHMLLLIASAIDRIYATVLLALSPLADASFSPFDLHFFPLPWREGD